jgi:hypothetical protein
LKFKNLVKKINSADFQGLLKLDEQIVLKYGLLGADHLNDRPNIFSTEETSRLQIFFEVDYINI